ncbi:hypothetical protein [Haloferula sp. BvORR071]|uniref:hypothetical protein n=1 Tax=Haloferula sp. BvORR071 TaxID=1396141 RepID=UPI002240FFCA|nr:hypothetical protein [Haloferula sp. BvORR071]
MKHLITLLTLGTAIFLAAPAAEARGHGYRPSRVYVEYHRSCRGPAYIERYVAYYDCHGCPVWRTRVIPIRHSYHGPSISVQWGRSCR